MKYIYNYKFEHKDGRDCKFTHVPLHFPEKFSLVDSRFPGVLDQGSLGSCTAQATSNALRYCLRKEGKEDNQPSRLFIYYYSRLLERTVNEDSGAYIRDVMKAVSKYGACTESSSEWPYIISKFKQSPPSSCVESAKKHIPNFQYLSVGQTESQLKAALVNGFPIVCGIMIYQSFEDDECMKTGHVPLPNRRTESLYGGHCVLIVGYDDSTREFLMENSWGTNVGDKGYFYIPYDFLTSPHLANDFWTLTYYQ